MRVSIRDLGRVAGAVLFWTAGLRADALWSGSAGGAPTLRDAGLKIRRIEGEKLFYDYRGKENSIELDKVARLSVDDQPVLTAAEDALAVEKWDEAVDNYQRVLRSGAGSNKPWMAQWASRRIGTAAEKSGRFDAAVAAFIARVQNESPGAVPRPRLPAERSIYLDTAAGALNSALSGSKLNDEQRATLLSFLIDVQRARRDNRAADQATDALDELLAKDPDNPNAARSIARRKLQAAQAAFDKKDYPAAIAEIDSARPKLSDPAQQADALYLLAEAKYQLASASREPGALKDAALAYMRVVAHFKDAPDRPHVAPSLLRTGQIFEALGDAPAALRVYDQLVAQYPDVSEAAPARQNAQRLRAGAGATSVPSSSPSSN